MKARHIIIPVILFFLAACEPVEVDNTTLQNPVEGNKTDETAYTLTVQAYKNVDTKALQLSGNTLNAYWADGEKVGIYVNGVRRGSLTAATPNAALSSTATLSGTISNPGDLSPNDVIWLLFPDRTDGKWDYTGQNGASPALADAELGTRYDYATASLTVTNVDSDNHTVTTSGPATFTNEQSMYRFGFKENGTGDPIAVKEFMISSNKGQLVRSREWSTSTKNWTSNTGSITVKSSSAPAGNLYYMALRNENITQDDTYSFQVIVGDNDALYLGSKVVAKEHLGNGHFVSIQGVPITQTKLSPSTSGTIDQASGVFEPP